MFGPPAVRARRGAGDGNRESRTPLVSTVSNRVARLERRMETSSSIPVAVEAALARMEARAALLDESVLQDLNRVVSESDGEPEEPITPTLLRRFERARRLLESDSASREQADQEIIVRGERESCGAPGHLAEKWAGDWRSRRLKEQFDDAARAMAALDIEVSQF